MINIRLKHIKQVVFHSLYIPAHYCLGLACFLPMRVATVDWRLTALNPDKAPARWPAPQPDSQSVNQIIQKGKKKKKNECPLDTVLAVQTGENYCFLVPALYPVSVTPVSNPPNSPTLLYRLLLKGLNEGNLVSRVRECTWWLTCLWQRFRDLSWCHVEQHMLTSSLFRLTNSCSSITEVSAFF